MATEQFKAYLRVKLFDTRETIHSVGLTDLRERSVERVMLGMLRNMNTEQFYIDDSEVDAARELAQPAAKGE